MFSVIVVDDEMMIRTSISTFINNCDVGFEVVGTFRDGSDAIKYLEENLSLIHISEPTRLEYLSRMPSSA